MTGVEIILIPGRTGSDGREFHGNREIVGIRS